MNVSIGKLLAQYVEIIVFCARSRLKIEWKRACNKELCQVSELIQSVNFRLKYSVQYNEVEQVIWILLTTSITWIAGTKGNDESLLSERFRFQGW